MAVRINHNAAALRAATDYSRVERDSQIRRTRLASGLTVNSGRDSGARLSVSEGMRAEIGGLAEGTRNAEQALDLLRTAEGAMSEMSNVLIRMRELAVESASGTLNDVNRESLDAEFNELKTHLDRIAKLASYNDEALLSGFGNAADRTLSTALTDAASTGTRYSEIRGASAGTYTFIDAAGDGTVTLGNGTVTQNVTLGSWLDDGAVARGTTQVVNFDLLGIKLELTGQGAVGGVGSYQDGDLDGKTIVVAAGTGGSFQLGSRALPADRLEYDITEMTTDGPVLDLAQISAGTRDGARHALAKLDATIYRTTRERGAVGAVMNRLEYTLNFSSSALESIHAAEATVRDADYAWETSLLTRNQILSQASLAALTQSRVPTGTVMQLLQ
ncbi:MAG: flagellin [Candidatus Latescibacterota bacterium]|jgi:flagellin